MAKGRTTEWEIATHLSECWNGILRDDIFMPTSASGARATSRNKRGKDTSGQFGDITFNDPIGKPLIDAWSIECKTGYTVKKKKKIKKTTIDNTKTELVERVIETPWDVLDLIDSNQEMTQFEEFIAQCKNDAIKTNREPVLIFRRNKRQLSICFREIYFKKMSTILENFEHRMITVNLQNGESFVIINFYAFLLWAGCLEDLIKNLS